MLFKFARDVLTAVSTTSPAKTKARLFCALNWAINEDGKRIKRLRNRHAGKRAFIIGNGPSLRMEDLERLKDQTTFVSNKIYLAYSKTSWRPTYHFVEDDKVRQSSMDVLLQSLSPKTQLFLGMDSKIVTRVPNAIYYWRDFDSNPYGPPFQMRPLGHAHMGYSVLYTCLQFALYMGITEVYLLGVDQNYTPSKTIVSQGVATTTVYKAEGEKNHFDPNYNQPGEEWYDPNLRYQQAGFIRAREVFLQHGRVIKNATRGGKLEVFERVDFDSLF